MGSSEISCTPGNVVLVGCGNMGAALLGGWLAQGMDRNRLHVIDSAPEGRERARSMQVRTSAAPTKGLGTVEVLVLAVKPQQLDDMLGDYTGFVEAGAAILSIAAGKPIAYYERRLGRERPIVRAMPNTPAAIGQGITALVANAAVDERQRAMAETLMRAVGDVVWLADESLMDAVTAVSGSGPAYVFLLIEALTVAGQAAGLDTELAGRLAMATVAGAGAYASRSELAPAALRRQVTSPGGTTQAALEVLMREPGLEQLVKDAVRAAAKRSRDLA
ncbi:MAG TPA: pyrroline-5-carboxylate reductase [Gammaproteobacteria bacterium]